VFGLLKGKSVNLRVVEKDDLALYAEWSNDPEFHGEYFFPTQKSRTETEKVMVEPSLHEWKDFVIEKKDRTKIGLISFFYVLHPLGKMLEMGYALIPSGRGKGYCTEAAQIMVDYLFLTKEANCVQSGTHVKNISSQRVLEKVGFRKEGTMRKRFYSRGEWQDIILFSILREEWKEPKILTRTT
jgi:RimJ/RimL family protein N-acetyltransferase